MIKQERDKEPIVDFRNLSHKQLVSCHHDAALPNHPRSLTIYITLEIDDLLASTCGLTIHARRST